MAEIADHMPELVYEHPPVAPESHPEPTPPVGMGRAATEGRVRGTTRKEVADDVRTEISTEVEESAFLPADLVVANADEVQWPTGIAVALVQRPVGAENTRGDDA